MTTVMRLAGDALGNAHPADGSWLRDCDFEVNGGHGHIKTTRDLAAAKRFADLAEALAFLKRVPECHPTRDDGKPNRPLTAFTWVLEPADEADE
jgi:hypothetical protein